MGIELVIGTTGGGGWAHSSSPISRLGHDAIEELPALAELHDEEYLSVRLEYVIKVHYIWVLQLSKEEKLGG